MTSERRIALADAWQRLAEALVAASPDLGRLLAERAERDWRTVPATERAVLLAAAITRVDPGVPSIRRRLRAFVLERSALRATDRVSEDTPAQRELDAVDDRWLVAAAADDFIPALDRAAGPPAAVRTVRARMPGLPEAAAVRFLRNIAYPAFQTDASRIRWLRRFGLLGDVPRGGEKAAAAAALIELSEAVGTPPDIVDRILGAFTGAEKLETTNGWCLTRPRCSECPVAEACPTGRALAEAGVATTAEAPAGRSLAATLLPQDRPREKLAARGAETLSDSELVAILLRTGSGGDNALTLANRLLARFQTLDRVADASVAELASLRGMGQVKAITVKAAMELARRLERWDPRQSGTLSSAADAFQFLRREFLGKKQESFVVLLLNQKSQVLRLVRVSEGTLTQSLVHPREAFKEAIRDSAASVIFAHNHPSGDPTPSRDDRLITQRLVKAGELVGVRVLDHIIVGRETFYSFADDGKLGEV